MLELAFHAAQLGLGVPALLSPLFLNAHHLVQGANQAFIGMLEGLDVHNAPLRLPGRFHSGGFEGVSVLFQQVIGQIGDLPLPLQVKLLRVLQEHEIEKIGGTKPIPVDVRIIAATRKNLQQMMEEGTFRADLYYRLAVVTIDTIPLREHPEDIMLYANMCLQQLNHKFKTNVLFSKNATRCLLKYSWPGNVRELDNVISSAFISSDQMMIDLSDLPSKISDAVRHEIPGEEHPETLKTLLYQYEADIIRETLEKYEHNVTAAAKHLGVERSLLYKKMKKLNITIHKNL